MSNCNSCGHNDVCAFRADRIKLNASIYDLYHKFPNVFKIDIYCKFYTEDKTSKCDDVKDTIDRINHMNIPLGDLELEALDEHPIEPESEVIEEEIPQYEPVNKYSGNHIGDPAYIHVNLDKMYR